MRKLILACAGLMALTVALGAAGARAQSAPPAIDDPEANVIEALVVNARLPGPAWWKVSDADTTVYILGIPPALPKTLSWDTSVLDRRLDGAFVLLTPAVSRAGLTDLPALLALRGKLKADHPLESTSPELADRLAKAWTQSGRTDDWRDWKPLGAGLLLSGAIQRKAGLVSSEPDRTINRLARRHRVEARPAAVYKAMPTLRTLVKDHTAETGLICLEGILDEAEGGPEAAYRAARAWAEGDVRHAVYAPRQGQRCVMALPGVAAEFRRLSDAQVEAIAQAMDTPGKAVAILNLRGLVAEEGVLQKLRARGFKITTPDDVN